MFFFIALLTFSLVLESLITSTPLVLIVLLLWYVARRKAYVFIAAFFAGIVLDGFTFGQMGISSLFYLLFLGIVGLYDRKFGINTLPFVAISSLVGSFIYALLMNHPDFLWESVVSAFSASLLFVILKKLL